MVNYSYAAVQKIIDKHERSPEALIAVLQDIQEEYSYLPENLLLYLAKTLGVASSRVYGVATFYENFSLEPKAKYLIKICDGTACHVKKSTEILAALRRELKISEEKRTTSDMLFTVETVSCIGACGLAPAIMVNDKIYPRMTPESTVNLLSSIREEETSG